MENTKYYEPSIDEFHVGFEFERPYSPNSKKWVKFMFKDGESAEQYCHPEESRVKYLDEKILKQIKENGAN